MDYKQEERLRDDKEELFEDYIMQDMVTDEEIVSFIMRDAELFTLLVDKWMESPKRRDKFREWFKASQADGAEGGEDR